MDNNRIEFIWKSAPRKDMPEMRKDMPESRWVMPEQRSEMLEPMKKDMPNDNMPEPKCPVARDCLSDMPIAMAYVPMQKWKKIYEPDVALSRGTIFEQLDLPFLGEEAN